DLGIGAALHRHAAADPDRERERPGVVHPHQVRRDRRPNAGDAERGGTHGAGRHLRSGSMIGRSWSKDSAPSTLLPLTKIVGVTLTPFCCPAAVSSRTRWA